MYLVIEEGAFRFTHCTFLQFVNLLHKQLSTRHKHVNRDLKSLLSFHVSPSFSLSLFMNIPF